MSILTDLEAALEAKQEAWAAFTAYTHGADQQALLDEYDIACGRYEALLTDDTVAALVAVARAVDKGKPTAARHALYPLVKEADDARCPTGCPGPCVIGCDGDAYGNRSRFE